MQTQIEAIFEDGVLKPLAKLDLPEHAHVQVTVTTADAPAPKLLPNWPRHTPADMHLADPTVSREEVRAAMAKIPVSIVDDIREERRGRL